MTKGDAGQNISKFASSSTDASKISTSLPYISYVDLGYWLSLMFNHALNAFSNYVREVPDYSARSAAKFMKWCDASPNYNDVSVS